MEGRVGRRARWPAMDVEGARAQFVAMMVQEKRCWISRNVETRVR